MRTITRRELRNDSAKVLRDVAAGESLLITNRGVVVARIVPADGSDPELAVTRPATKRGFDDLPLYDRPGPSSLEVLDDLRGDR